MKRKTSPGATAPISKKSSSARGIRISTPSSSRAGSVVSSKKIGHIRSESLEQSQMKQNSILEAPSDDEGQHDDDDDDDFQEALLGDDDFKRQEQLDDQSKEDMALLVQSFSKEQRDRYEVYRRSQLSKNTVKKLMNHVLNQSVSQNVALVCAGFTKVFVGEMVEMALDVQKEWGHNGSLAPEHLREAYRRCRMDRLSNKRMFR